MNLNLNSVHAFVTEFKTGKHWHSASFSPALNSGPQTTSSGRYLLGSALCSTDITIVSKHVSVFSSRMVCGLMYAEMWPYGLWDKLEVLDVCLDGGITWRRSPT
jgi:hypothetical protein